MIIQTVAQAIQYANKATTRYFSPVEAVKKLDDFKSFLADTTDETDRTRLKESIHNLENWISSDEFKNGNYPQGIDVLILDLIEWRAMIYAFQAVESKSNPFQDFPFFSQWSIGAAYAMISIVGKLTSKNKDDNSLRKLWNKIRSFITNVTTDEELQFIDKHLESHFSNVNSRAISFRNKVIAHNEKTLSLKWSEIDEDIKILVRVWSIIVGWCSFGIFSPFRTASAAFSGLDSFYTPTELQELKAKRKEYLDKVKTWSASYLHTGEKEVGFRGAFGSITVTINTKNTTGQV